MSAPTLNEEFKLPDRSYPVLGIQEYFEYIIKKHKTATDSPSTVIYVRI